MKNASTESKSTSRKALFIIGSTAQAEMFKPILKELQGWVTIAINIDMWHKKDEIDAVLQRLSFPHKSISSTKFSAISEVLRKEKPDIIVVAHDRLPKSRLFIKCGNSMGIPTLLVQDGILPGNRASTRETGGIVFSIKYFLFLPHRIFRFMTNPSLPWQQKIEITLFESRLRGKAGNYGHGECQKMALFGDATKEMFISEGVNPDKIVVTGNPKFDLVYHSKDNNCKNTVCEKWNIPAHKEIVLLLTSYFVENNTWSLEQRERFVIAISNAVEALPNAQLIIKLHPPHENEKDYSKIIKKISSHAIVCKHFPISMLLNACDLAITVSSTAALEAMAIGKPVIIANLFHDKAPYFYKNSGALFIETESEILPALKKGLYDFHERKKIVESTDKFVYKQAYLQDGRASERIASIIRNMVSANGI